MFPPPCGNLKLPDGEIVTYGYNKGGQLSGVGSSKGKPYVSGIKYNVTGQRTQINYGNGTGTSYEYDERNHRLKRLETRNAKSILQTIEYEYDDTGNVTERESEMLGTDGRMKHAIHEYEYDSSGRLTEGSGKVEKTTAGILRPNIVSYKSKYSYDTIGNILTKTQAVNGGESSLSCNDTYTYGGKQPHAVTKAGAMVFTYDDNGNMIKRENTETKNTMTLVWDDENRLIKTTDSLHTTDYRYDANGERIIKKSELGETQYVSANYIVRNKTVVSKHIFAGNQRVASTVSMKDNCGTVSEKNTMYFHPDHLGSSSYVTDKKGNFFEMIEYLPYGETLYDEAATVDKTEFRFTSKEQDAETGLYYHGARYRDAKTGVWLSVDPILEKYLPTGNKEKDRELPAGGVFNTINLNLYHYGGNNPIMFCDPDGTRDISLNEIRAGDILLAHEGGKTSDIQKAGQMLGHGMIVVSPIKNSSGRVMGATVIDLGKDGVRERNVYIGNKDEDLNNYQAVRVGSQSEGVAAVEKAKNSIGKIDYDIKALFGLTLPPKIGKGSIDYAKDGDNKMVCTEFLNYVYNGKFGPVRGTTPNRIYNLSQFLGWDNSNIKYSGFSSVEEANSQFNYVRKNYNWLVGQ